MGALDEAKEWAKAGGQEVVEYCKLTIPPDDEYLEARWMARLSGSAWALGRYVTQNWNLTTDEFNVVTNSWFDEVIEGLMDEGIVGDDRAMVVS